MAEVLKAIDEVRGIRKHHTQMTAEEKNVLKMLIRGKFQVTQHSLQRMKERRITVEEVNQTINDGNIIEYHLINGEESRVLLRGRVPFRDRVTCVVVDINNNIVVTAYKNYYLNNHPNSDMSDYDATLNVLEKVKSSFNSGKTSTYKYTVRANKTKTKG
jgi:hypothetical protein